MSDKIIAYVDGGSRGNPGPAACAYILSTTNGNVLRSAAFFLGHNTNNIAEYSALNKAIEAAAELHAEKITVFSDSQLLVKQINGQYKVKSEKIKTLFNRAQRLLQSFEDWQVQFVPREKNKQADQLVNKALNLQNDVVMKSENETKISTPDKNAVRLGVLISGGGRTMFNILDHIDKGALNARIELVISSRSTVAGVEKAKNAGLNVKIIRKKDHPDVDDFSKVIEDELLAAKVELVVQAGWLCLWNIPNRYQNRVMNIHPALLPSFGGKGMWGHNVHEAVLERGCKVSGCTVHLCTNEYDKGPIIVQRCCEVKQNDTPDTLASRVFQQECIAYPQAIKLFQQNRMAVQNNKVIIK